MANPKRRHSRARSRTRRGQDKAVAPTLTVCAESGKKVRRHTICPTSGFYRGRRVLSIKVKSKEKKGDE